MPWCDTCDAYRAPNSLKEDGHCATCDSEVDGADLQQANQAPVKAPWHFWLMVIALVLYLGWRLVDGVIWIIDKI